MANAITMQITGTSLDLDGTLRISYESFVRDDAQNISGYMAVNVRVPASMTPQQFRSALTAETIEVAKSVFPTVTLAPGDCLIDVMQRGN